MGELRRVSCTVLALFATIASAASAQEPAGAPSRGEVRILVQSSPLAGIQYYTAKQWWDEMRTRDRLVLVREPANRHDANAIRVEWKGHKLGYLPKRENQVVAQEMDRGARLEASISTLQRHRSPWQRLKMDIYVLPPASAD
ncbi:MAG: HIRAN domain-containing protein [Rhodospirillales bacterium]